MNCLSLQHLKYMILETKNDGPHVIQHAEKWKLKNSRQ